MWRGMTITSPITFCEKNIPRLEEKGTFSYQMKQPDIFAWLDQMDHRDKTSEHKGVVNRVRSKDDLIFSSRLYRNSFRFVRWVMISISHFIY